MTANFKFSYQYLANGPVPDPKSNIFLGASKKNSVVYTLSSVTI